MRRASLLVDFVAVVIPAHDEEEMIGPCLEALDRACRHEALRGLEVRPILVLDRCSDSTGERSEAAARTTARRLTILETCRANVGVARRRGFETALELSEGLDPRRAWFATTDADTLVRPDWLAGQLAWRQRRVDAVAGTVEVGSWAEQPGTLPRRYERHVKRHGLGLGHPHVHGANLSFSRASYEAAGGMPALPADEDHAMWHALKISGAVAVAVPDIPVATSARREGRAPKGFSGFLRDLGSRPA